MGALSRACVSLAGAENRAGCQCFISFEPYADRLGETIKAISAERVLFASDYPHTKLSGSPQIVMDRPDISTADKTKIMGANAIRLLRLD